MIIWSDEARITFDAIVLFIETAWGKQRAANFIRKVQKKLATIEAHPYLYPASTSAETRKALISRQCSVYYKIYPDSIWLIYFWDNRQEPLFD